MNKLAKTLLCMGVCSTMMFAVGCGGNNNPTPSDGTKKYDSETRTLRLSTGALDGNFHPFFYTAANDGNMIANTQIGMLTSDEGGNIVCGNNQPTVVLDYRKVYYNAKSGGNVVANGTSDGRTEYELVIKNGIKFSDGKDLTIADVLFNLYVYLDPAYTGSSTIYSTDIQGLKAYRAQDASLTDESESDFESGFVADAMVRINKLIDWSNDGGALTTQMSEDLDKVKKAFLEELESDWTNTSTSWSESYKDTYRFTAAWQAYLYEHGTIVDQRKINSNASITKYYEDTNNNGKRDDGELYYTTLDPYQPNSYGGTEGEVGAQDVIDDIARATTQDKINEYMTKNEVTDEAYAKEMLEREYCINTVYDNYTDQSEIANVLQFWATGSAILEKFTNEERTNYFATIPENERVRTISGITTYTATGGELASSFGGEMNETYVSTETYSVLKIVINGIDPKAIYNFAFSVAPLHYYSGSYGGVNYAELGKTNYNVAGQECFGVAVGDSGFFSDVLQAPAKVGLPVGAGPYKAADQNGNPTSDRNKFLDSNIVSFVRNENFETLGSGISNAKIKKVQYKVLADDSIMTALTEQSIDFGMPNATPTNSSTLTGYTNTLESKTYLTSGYGYVGINPKFVPEYQVRQAIMKAMNTNETLAYYGGNLASSLYRPVTKTSWAYDDENWTSAYYPYSFDDEEIKQLVADAGYTIGSDGVYTKTSNAKGGASNASRNSKLKLTFTIAGETTNHPAYQMFCNTRDRLNALGFDITVKTDVQALKNLATGNLHVWAAAWTSAIDPDPYQVYHKDSNATSVLNWNYNNILNDSTSWGYEYDLIQKISNKIDEGRATDRQNEREDIYHECFDLIMDLAVELPTYQRSDMCVYNKTIINGATLVQNPSFNMGLFDKLWEIDYV